MPKGVWRPRSERMPRDEYLTRAAEFSHRASAKLTQSSVIAIRENRYGKTARQLAERYGVHYRTVEKIRSGETWKDTGSF